MHGNAGAFDLPLPLSGQPGLESRSGGPNGAHPVVLSFTNGVVSGAVSVTGGTASIAGTPIISGNPVTVNLTNVANAQQITLGFVNLTDTFGQKLPSTALQMKLLLGDTNGDQAVNSGDAIQTRNRSGQMVDATNFRCDVNVDGSINSGDAITVRSKSGTAISP